MAQRDDNKDDSLMMGVLFKISESIHELRVESGSNDKITSRGPQEQYKKMLLRQNLMKKVETDSLNKKIKMMTDSIRRQEYRKTVITIVDIINEIATDSQKSYIINNIKYSYNVQSPSTMVTSPYSQDGLIARSRVPKPDHSSKNQLDFDQLESLPEPTETTVEIKPEMTNYGSGLKQPITKYNMSEHYLIANGINKCRDKLEDDFKNTDEKENRCSKDLREMESKNVLQYVVNEEIAGEKSLVETLAEKYPASLQEVTELMKVNKSTILKSQIFFQLAKRDPSQLKHFIYALETNHLADRQEIRRVLAENKFNGETVAEVLKKDKKRKSSVIEDILEYISKYKPKQPSVDN